jgi:hypothetical protein
MATGWAKKLGDIPLPNENKPSGDDWFTINELRSKMNWGKDRTYRYVSEKIDDGLIEVYRGNEFSDAHSQLVRRVWYRFI